LLERLQSTGAISIKETKVFYALPPRGS
jgi:hypothetical protein